MGIGSTRSIHRDDLLLIPCSECVCWNVRSFSKKAAPSIDGACCKRPPFRWRQKRTVPYESTLAPQEGFWVDPHGNSIPTRWGRARHHGQTTGDGGKATDAKKRSVLGARRRKNGGDEQKKKLLSCRLFRCCCARSCQAMFLDSFDWHRNTKCGARVSEGGRRSSTTLPPPPPSRVEAEVD